MIPDKTFIETELASGGLNPVLYVFSEVDSTNTRAREILADSSDEILVLASAQLKGKGSHGRSFFSPADTGLYFTASFSGLPSEHPVTFAAAVASVKALGSCGIDTEIKWVNDIFLSGKKAGGILCERISSGAVIVGIGINLEEPQGGFPDDIKRTAVSVGSHREIRDRLAVELYRELVKAVNQDAGEIIRSYRDVCGTVGRRISFEIDGNRTFGTALSVDEDGSLTVEQDGGDIIKLISGNVSVRY
ncbi:MAG: biotin--[Oscillospiraceae bacterium]|nr:biotin--[acetyl-CoA-carboxylase] ligase [Oscillospiraceae bacterium]